MRTELTVTSHSAAHCQIQRHKFSPSNAPSWPISTCPSVAPRFPTPRYTALVSISCTWNVFPFVAASESPVLASKQWLMGVISSSHSTLANARTSFHGLRKAGRKDMKTGYALRRLCKMQNLDEHHAYGVRVHLILYLCCHVISWF